MSETVHDLRFEHPSRWVIYGPSGSGKSTFINYLLKSIDDFFKVKFDRIIYCCNYFNSINKHLEKILEINNDFITSLDLSKNNLLVIDDRMQQAINNELVSDLFTKLSHYLNTTVIFITQNLFPKSKYMRDISLNTNYLVLMKNNNEKLQIRLLANRIEGHNNSYKLTEAYNEATKKPFSHLLIDMCQTTPDILKYRSDIFNELYQITYI